MQKAWVGRRPTTVSNDGESAGQLGRVVLGEGQSSLSWCPGGNGFYKSTEKTKALKCYPGMNVKPAHMVMESGVSCASTGIVIHN